MAKAKERKQEIPIKPMTKEELDASAADMCRHREEKFAVKIEAMRPSERMYPDEVTLLKTTNGHQWSGMSLCRREAIGICMVIIRHFEIHASDLWSR